MTYHAFLVATYEEKLGACETTYMSALELIQLILEFSQTFSISTTESSEILFCYMSSFTLLVTPLADAQ
ncbi:hypothetical protein Mmol_1492 [Methylotenera mobilis JLW8]|uniref:Uncharacterized protein n=1 Tax=Methylotenera mobilis (strain JLW8 / ATCC BAA-1282 / DSM 17540) TaxID=583345 RepID=C6WWU7_METML|nr:hypothetical protein Mmol_1492 [Methylotenera mobilis JLW8]